MDPLTIRLGSVEGWGAVEQGCEDPSVPAAPVQSSPCAVVGLAPGVETPASGASLKLDAQPRACGEEGNEKLRSRLFFFPLLN